MAVKLFDIDGEKLRREFAIRKLDMREISKEMGFDDSFLHNCTAPSKEKINITAKNYLEKVYNIPFDSYAVKESKEQATAPQVIKVNVDNVTIDSKTIETALINVLTNEEVRKQITQIIYFAVNKALRNNN